MQHLSIMSSREKFRAVYFCVYLLSCRIFVKHRIYDILSFKNIYMVYIFDIKLKISIYQYF